jgi:glycosyltransferase involved in cell wall biosynthesis
LIVLFSAAAALCGSIGPVKSIVVNGHELIRLGLLAWPLTLMWIVGVAVSINFIDGLDGLAAGVTAIAAGVLALGATCSGYFPAAWIALALMGALCGFLIYNFNPAKIFMGDCGSLFIGFVLAGDTVLAAQHGVGAPRSFFLPGLTLSLPLMDSFLTLIRRGVLQRRSLFAAERGHIHHRLLDTGLSHVHVVLLMYAVTAAAAVVAMVSMLGIAGAELLAACGFIVVLVALFRTAGSVKARETLRAIRRNRAIGRETRRYQRAFEDVQISFREVKSFNAWWHQLCKAAGLFDFAKLNLPLTRRDGSTVTLRWRRDDSELASSDAVTAEVPIPQRRTGVNLRIEVEISVNAFLETAGQRVALFSRLIGEYSLQHLPDDERSESEHAERMPIAMDMQKASVDAASAGRLPKLRVALVHDFLYTYAGAERVLEQFVALFPHADIFSLFDFLPKTLRSFIRGKTVRSTFLQKMPLAASHHRAYLPFMPLAIEQLDVSEYDLVVSSSYLVAKGVITHPSQLHICYCHTPARFAWDMQNKYLAKSGLFGGVKSIVARLILHYFRSWDVRSANGVDVFIANSNFVGERIRKFYRRPAVTLYPPVDTDWFSPTDKKEDFYVTASRLVPYKRIDLVVDTFNRLSDRRLVVVGEGPELERLRALAGPNIRLVGYQPPERLRQYLQRARAFVFAAEEDFGIAPVEAQACGTPVIAFGRGGVRESVLHGKTGILFDHQTVDSLANAITQFEQCEWDSNQIRENAMRFSIHAFREQFTQIVHTEWSEFLVERIEKTYRASRSDSATAVPGRDISTIEGAESLLKRSSDDDATEALAT